MPKQLTINGALYIRADQIKNQQSGQSSLTSALNTGQGNGLTIKIFADNGQNRNSRQNRRRQGKNNRAQ